MSQKNETTILTLALLLTVGIVGGGFWWFTNNGVRIGNPNIQNQQPGNNPSLQDRISFGEKSFTPGDISPGFWYNSVFSIRRASQREELR